MAFKLKGAHASKYESSDSEESEKDELSDEDEESDLDEENSSVDEEEAVNDQNLNEIKPCDFILKKEVSEDPNFQVFFSEALADFLSTEKDDLSFKKGETLKIISLNSHNDGWWEAINTQGQKGIVPSAFLKVPKEYQKHINVSEIETTGHRNTKLWDKLRSTVKQSHNFEEAIIAMGAVPVGFCQATLKKLLKENPKYSTEAFLAPKRDDSGLLFRDLQLSSNTKSLKPVATNLLRSIRLVAFRQVPFPDSGFSISSCHVYVCLHDSSKVLSNIHTIRAKYDPKSPKTWSFSKKLPINGSSLEEGRFFIRSNSTSPTVGILFQLCISFTKIETDESGEMSCGWVFMRLLDDSGQDVPNGTRSLKIHSGEPFMNQNNTPSKSAESGPLKLFMSRRRRPRLVTSVLTIKRKYSQIQNLLPSNLIATMSSIPLLVLYRKILADKLLKNRSIDNTDIIQSPFLANFPKAMETPDVIDVFRKCWHDKIQRTKQSTLKSEQNRLLLFQQTFMESAFLILHCKNVPTFVLEDIQSERTRKLEIIRLMKLIKDKGPFAAAVSPEFYYDSLSLKDMSIDVIGPYSVPINDID